MQITDITMATFAELKEQADFIKLDGQRYSVISCLNKLKSSMVALPTDKPSLRSFNRLEKAIDEELANLTAIDKKIAQWFITKGGEELDSDFADYEKKSVTILTALEAAQNSYHDLIESKGLLKPEPAAPPPVGQADLVEALKVLAESSGRHAAATEQQAKAILQHHRTPQMELPIFNPATCRGNPLAWVSFWQKFENFAVDCISDRARLGFLMSAVKGDALQLIRNLQCVDENYAEAKKILEEQYNKSKAVNPGMVIEE